MKTGDIIEKIKKLLEINRSNGATEAEETAALERANVLMTKYQIERFQLQGNIKSKNVEKNEKLNDQSLSFGCFRGAVGNFFGVLALYNKNYYSFYGFIDNVNLALSMTKRAETALSLEFTNYLCSDAYRRNRATASRKKVKDSFRDGFYLRIAHRLEQLIDERASATVKATGTDLVALNEENLDRAYNDDFGYTPKSRRERKAPDRDFEAFSAGKEKGSQFQILDEVTNENDQNR